jgi:hypothetical protein
MFCRENYDIPMGSSVGNNLYVCGDSGNWKPSQSIPDCASMLYLIITYTVLNKSHILYFM